MAELTPLERLQPSLLDRLTDNEPGKKQETREKRIFSVQKLREVVLRDLVWLLNSGNLKGTEDLEDYPFVSHSVVNYGMPELAGVTSSSIDVLKIERLIRQVIWDFEPRILRHTVKVRVSTAENQMNTNAMTLEIEGQLWAQPIPIHLFLKTEIDLESGNITLKEY